MTAVLASGAAAIRRGQTAATGLLQRLPVIRQINSRVASPAEAPEATAGLRMGRSEKQSPTGAVVRMTSTCRPCWSLTGHPPSAATNMPRLRRSQKAKKTLLGTPEAYFHSKYFLVEIR